MASAYSRLLTVALASYLLALLGYAVGSIVLNGGLVYTLDDPYIHMSIARSLALHGVYGVTPEAYESASSSPGWTLILTLGLRLIPWAQQVLPFVLNALGGAVCLVLLLRGERFLRDAGGLRAPLCAAALPFVLFLPGLTTTGMEHTLHAAAVLAIFVNVQTFVMSCPPRRTILWLLLLFAGATVLRFETLFFASGCAAGVFIVRLARNRVTRRGLRDWIALLGPSAAILLATAVPVIAYGLFNVSQGQYFFPNSIVAKTGLSSDGLAALLPNPRRVAAIRHDPLLSLLCAIAAIYVVSSARRRRTELVAEAIILMGATTLQLLYASIGWYDRYQAHLVVIGVYFAFRVADRLRDAGHLRLPSRRAWVSVAVVLSLAVSGKLIKQARAVVASTNIYQQQVQMGRFFAQHYSGEAVAVNDLGAVVLLHGAPVVDLVGLGTHEVVRARKEGRFNRGFVETLVKERQVQAIAIYESWFTDEIPDAWVKLATWKIRRRVTAGSDTVTFFAPDRERAGVMAHRLHAFEPTLPAGVAVRYYDAAAW